MTNNWESELRNAFKFLHANKEFDLGTDVEEKSIKDIQRMKVQTVKILEEAKKKKKSITTTKWRFNCKCGIVTSNESTKKGQVVHVIADKSASEPSWEPGDNSDAAPKMYCGAEG